MNYKMGSDTRLKQLQRTLRTLRQNVFDYDDEKEAKAQILMERIKNRLGVLQAIIEDEHYKRVSFNSRAGFVSFDVFVPAKITGYEPVKYSTIRRGIKC